MEEVGLQLTENALADGNSQWDAERIIEQIWRDLGGAMSRSHIRRVLMEISPAYENACVKTFVPILLHRNVLQRLREELDLKRGAKSPEPENTSKVYEKWNQVKTGS